MKYIWLLLFILVGLTLYGSVLLSPIDRPLEVTGYFGE